MGKRDNHPRSLRYRPIQSDISRLKFNKTTTTYKFDKGNQTICLRIRERVVRTGDVKAYGELPESAKINETDTYGQEGDGDCNFEFDEDRSESEDEDGKGKEIDVDDI